MSGELGLGSRNHTPPPPKKKQKTSRRPAPQHAPAPLPPPAGWWFDACGLSNLNGIYYPARHNIRKLNGIRWHYFQGPSYSLKGTRMLIRPAGF